MVVEVIHVEDIWIVAHEEDQYTDFFVCSTQAD